jgi:hypothetical protein
VSSPSVPRRAVLRLAGASVAAIAVAGCIPGRDDPPERDPVAEAVAAVWAGEQALIARYAQVLDRFPALTGRLGGLRDDHVAHAAALRAVLDARRPATGSPSPSATSPRPVPATPAAALAELVGAESAAAAAAAAACLLDSGDAAALLASVSACESSHLVVLR